GAWHAGCDRRPHLAKPVYGFASTSRGAPTDGYGRLLSLDTFGSRYGNGWRRENAFLPHRPTGVFCAGFYPHGGRPPGNGSQYRPAPLRAGGAPRRPAILAGPHDYRRRDGGG